MKRSVILAVSIGLAAMIVGCSGMSQNDEKTTAQIAIGETEESNATAEGEKNEKREEKSDSEENIKPEAGAEDSSTNGFIDFINGNKKAVISISDGGAMKQNESYSFDELREKEEENLRDEWSDPDTEHIASISYGEIDCGMDGIPEYVLKIEADDGSGMGGMTQYYVFRESAGVLSLFRREESYYRSYASINRDGVINFGGSGGAAVHYDGYAVIDADGWYNYIYQCETDYGIKNPIISRYSLPNDIELPEDYPEDDFDENGIVRYVYSFIEDPDYDSPDYDDRYNEYARDQVYVFEKDENGEAIYPDDKYMELYRSWNIEVADMDFVNDMIDEKLGGLGITRDDLKDNKEPDWVSVFVKEL